MQLGIGIGPNFILPSSGGGAAVPASLSVKPAFNRTKQPYANILSDGTNTQGKYVIRHKSFAYAVEGGVKFWFANRRGETDGQNSITVSSEYEYPYLSGTWTAMTFSAAASVTIAANSLDIACDTIALSIPANTYIRTRTLVTVASAGQKWPIMERLFLAAASNEGFVLGTTSLAATAVPNADTQTCYGPVAISGLTRAPIAVAVSGDSISGGAYGDSSLDQIGWIQKVLNGTYPVFQSNTGGETAATFVTTHNKRMALLDQMGCTHVIVAYGTNDADDAAALQANLSDIYKLFYYRNLRVTAAAILTYTTSSNNWTDAAGQSYAAAKYAPAGSIDVVNAWMAALPTYVDKFADTRVGYQDANRKILTDGTAAKYVGDGIGLHPSEYAYTQIAAQLTPATLINATLLDSGVPPIMASAVVDLNAESLSALANGASVTTWSDTLGTTATEATNPPTYVTSATPSGKPSVKFNGGTQKLSAPARSAINNLFGATGGGYIIEVTKQNNAGGGGFARRWVKGGDRVSIASANTLAAVLDFSTSDPLYNLPTITYGKWQIMGLQLQAVTPFAHEARLDGAPPVSFSGGGTGTYVDNSASPLLIANSAAGDRGLDGEISRFVMWKTAPGAIDREIAFIYLRRLAGIVF